MTEELTIQKQEELVSDPEFRAMIDAGVFYGRKKSKTHPRMKPYVLGNRNGIEIINLLKTKEFLEKALNFLKEKATGGANMLFVATQPQAESVAKTAAELGIPAVSVRWLGGTLTNFRVIQSRIEYFRKLKSDQEKGELEKYTKKERLKIGRELNRLKELFSGMENMNALPEVLVMIDTNVHRTAVREARRMKIPVVALISTDADPAEVDYPVFGNTRAKASIDWFISKIKEALTEAKSRMAAQAQAGQASGSENLSEDSAKVAKKEEERIKA
jgi:small subunit ribosomal protein S2